jgi:D-alanyl-D-alanine-carboxypeptidase/D-alanyl-D-alanine-endopeptidase
MAAPPRGGTMPGMRTPPASELIARQSPQFPSLALAVVEESGSSVTLAGRTPPTSTTLFQIGSVTKVFTALVLARHVVRGAVALDQPVAELLPSDWRWPSGPPITLGELATHSSGLPRIPPGMWGKVWRRDPDPYADVGAGELAAALARIRLRRRGRQRYSNMGAGLLGHALAHHREMSYAELVAAEVTGPLGMRDTVVERSEDQVARSATGHTRRGTEHRTAWQFDAMAGAGALWSTPDDLQVFLRAHLNPSDDELGAAIRLAMSPHLAASGGPHGLGWIRTPGRRGPDGWFHNGGTAGFRSIVVVCPEAQRASVALANADRSVDGLGIVLALG